MSDQVKITASIVTTSDSRTIDDDVSGRKLKELLEAHGAAIASHTVVADEPDAIRDELMSLSQRPDVNLVLTTGGTGLGPRDNTPEATLAIIDREVPGIAEAMRRETAVKKPFAILSRGVAGTRNGTLIINFPGSPKGVEECFEVIAPILAHAVRMMMGDTRH